jgi:geranylgeranyl reductase family protein
LTGKPPQDLAEVLIVGGGPAGAAAAAVLSRAGVSTLVLERLVYPRPKTCGDVIDPAAVHQLAHLGVRAADLEGADLLDGIESHRVQSRRRGPFSPRFEPQHLRNQRNWPVGPTGLREAYSIRRDRLDQQLIANAQANGAQVLSGHEAVAPLLERGFVRGASVRGPDGRIAEFPARFTLVADGANSRFGRALGTYRNRDWPYATSIRGYWASASGRQKTGPRNVQLHFDLCGIDGRPLLGYGWAVPLNDGTFNIGLTVMSTSHGFRSINTSNLLTDLVHRLSAHIDITPGAPISPPVSGRIPLGGSVGPSGGPTHLVVGDAAGSANAITGAGIEYALATGQMAGHVIAEAFAKGNVTVLQSYPGLLMQRFSRTNRYGRLISQASAHPHILNLMTRHLVQQSRSSDWAWHYALTGSNRQWMQ